jgi:protein-disulfide isomerase
MEASWPSRDQTREHRLRRTLMELSAKAPAAAARYRGPGRRRPYSGSVPPTDSTDAAAPSPVAEGDHVLGADRPAVTLLEYGDFGCPHCFASWRPVESLLDRYEGLRLVWRHFPDPQLHPGADLAAELSEFAAAHGKFWDAHSLLLAGRESFTIEGLLEVAGILGLDPVEAEAALRDHTNRAPVAEDIADGERAGVHGTPTFFIDGARLTGHWRQLAQVVPAALHEVQT